MRQFKLIVVALSACLFLTSCGNDDDPFIPTAEPGKYENGTFILNEGPFSDGSGSITFYDEEKGETSQNIFQTENNDTPLGSIVQSMYIHNDRAYIVVNNSNKIEVVNANTFESIGTIAGLEQPRYFLPINNDKAAVSQWGADKATGAVVIVDLNTFEIGETIFTGVGTEEMIIRDNHLYAANAGFLTPDSTVAVINLDNYTLTETIEVGYDPAAFEIDNNNNLWVLCKGHWDPEIVYNGSLMKIDNNNVATEALSLLSGVDNLTIDKDKNTLFYTDFAQIFAFDIQATTSTAIYDQYFYGLDVDPVSGNLYAADAKDFTSNGEVLIINTSGVLQETISAGVIPGAFWFAN